MDNQRDRLQKTRLFPFLLSALLFLLPAACTQAPSGDAEEGKRWYSLHRCNGCHGEDGRGNRALRIANTNLSYRKFIGKIRVSNSSIMPSFPKSTIPDEDVADIYVYLQAE